MKRKHARLYQYQLDWLASEAPDSFNLSGYVREVLDAVIPPGCIPPDRLPKSEQVTPDLWYQEQGWATLSTSRRHLTLLDYQKSWVESNTEFFWSQYVRDRLDERVDDRSIPDERQDWRSIADNPIINQ